MRNLEKKVCSSGLYARLKRCAGMNPAAYKIDREIPWMHGDDMKI
jgi:hypothetical protein